jgi:hypothetical protein
LTTLACQVTATAIAGSITFDPENDTIMTPGGKPFKFEAPFGKELPPKGFDPGEDTFQASHATRMFLPFLFGVLMLLLLLLMF